MKVTASKTKNTVPVPREWLEKLVYSGALVKQIYLDMKAGRWQRIDYLFEDIDSARSFLKPKKVSKKKVTN